MKTFAIMIIWFGSSQFAQFDVERFPSMEECLAAKEALVRSGRETLFGGALNSDAITCREVHP